MPNIKVSQDTYVRLNKIKATMILKNGKTRSFDDVLVTILKVYEAQK